jgi:hypothetical protein
VTAAPSATPPTPPTAASSSASPRNWNVGNTDTTDEERNRTETEEQRRERIIGGFTRLEGVGGPGDFHLFRVLGVGGGTEHIHHILDECGIGAHVERRRHILVTEKGVGSFGTDESGPVEIRTQVEFVENAHDREPLVTQPQLETRGDLVDTKPRRRH